jgi:glycosyltransferase involved in cell wall biosynthesis
VGYVTDAELFALYRNAALFIYPSLYEGFGLPAVEAMASGCPVVASTAEAIVEVCGDAARYVSPHDPAGLAAVIRELMADPDERRRMSDAGRARVDRYNWEQAARIVLSTLRELSSSELQ